MATIPANPNRRTLTTGQQGIVQAPGGSAAVDMLGDVSSGLDKVQQVRDQDELAKAKNKYALVKVEQDNAYNDDGDFKTINERWKTNVSEARAIAAQGITNPDAKEAFLMETEVNMAEGEARINELAGTKAKSWERGQIDEEMSILRDSAMQDNVDIGYINSAVQERLDAAANRGIISFEEAQKSKKNFTNDLAVSRLKMMTPQDRIKALGQSWVKDGLAPDAVKLLRDEAKEELRLGVAQEAAMNLIDNADIDPLTARRELYKKFKGDPEQLQVAMQQFDQVYNDNRVAVAQDQDEAYDMADELVASGTSMMQLQTDFKPLYDRLSVAQRKDLRNMSASKAAGYVRKYSDMDVVDKLNELIQDGTKGIEIAEFYSANRSKLNEADKHFFSKAAAEGRVGGEIKGVMSAYSELMLRTKGWTPEKTNKLIDDFKAEYRKFTDLNNREPEFQELDDMVSAATEKVSVPTGWFGISRDKNRFEMDLTDKIDALKDIPDFRQQLAYAASFQDPDVHGKLTLETYKLNWPELYDEAMSQIGDAPLSDADKAMILSRMMKKRADATN